jgi:hypothetical protein
LILAIEQPKDFDLIMTVNAAGALELRIPRHRSSA